MNHSSWSVPAHSTLVFKPKSHQYCLCIPVINEGHRFINQLKKISKYADMLDIIICDGGSTDYSTNPDFLRRQGVTALLTKTGAGFLSAQLRMGYAFALRQGYLGVITMDGNGKDGVDALLAMVRALQQGFDYVQGSRFKSGGKAENTPWMRHIANRFFHAPVLSLASGHYWFTDTTNGFRAYSSAYLLHPQTQPFRSFFQRYELLAYLTVRASQIGLRVTEIPVSRSYPKKIVPTKIKGVKSILDLLRTLLLASLGYYSPEKTNITAKKDSDSIAAPAKANKAKKSLK